MVSRVSRRPTAPPVREVDSAKPYPGGLWVNKSEDVVVGIDQSLTGFAIVAMGADGKRWHGWLYRSKKGTGIVRLQDIETFLFRTLEIITSAGPVQHVCMEGYAHGREYNREAAGELGAVTKRTLCEFFGWSEKVGFPTIVPPPSLKKFVTGKGNAPKQQILLGAYKKWGVDLDDDNVADAYGLGKVACAVVSGDADLAYEREVLANLQEHTEWQPPVPPPSSTRQPPTSPTRSRPSRSRATPTKR